MNQGIKVPGYSHENEGERGRSEAVKPRGRGAKP